MFDTKEEFQLQKLQNYNPLKTITSKINCAA